MKKLLTLLSLLMVQILYSQSGAIDFGFNTNDLGLGNGDGGNDVILTAVKQPDGKIVIGGAFTAYNGVSRNYIARLNYNGSLDPTFDPGTGFATTQPNYIIVIKLLPDGKILAGGDFTSYNGFTANRLARLLPDGSFDTSFNMGTGANGTVFEICLLPDNKILIGGLFSSWDGNSVQNIARLHEDGSFDNTFQCELSEPVLAIKPQPDGKILVGGRFRYVAGSDNHRLVRLMPDGSVDASFTSGFSGFPVYIGFMDPWVRDIAFAPGNKIIVVGFFHTYFEQQVQGIVCLNDDGSLDPTFNIANIGGGIYASVSSIIPLSSGKYMICGSFETYGGAARKGLALIDSGGILDNSFIPPPGNYSIHSFLEEDDNHYIIAGELPLYNNLLTRKTIIRIGTDATYDLAFNPGTGANFDVHATHIQNDGKILIGGRFQFYNGVIRKGIARLNTTGALDPTFNPGEGTDLAAFIYSITTQSDGKILLGGTFTMFDSIPSSRIVRLNSNGSLDLSFETGSGFNNVVFDIDIQPDGKIIVAGSFSSYNGVAAIRIVRLNPDGSRDTSFNSAVGVNNSIRSISIQPDEKIIIGGSFTLFDNIPRSNIARLNPDGTLDMGFDPGTGVNVSPVFRTALQSDGKIMIGGQFTMFNGITRNAIARLNEDGSLDVSFDAGADFGQIKDIVIQQNGTIVIGGYFSTGILPPAHRIAWLNDDGSLCDIYQLGSGFNHFVESLALQTNGYVVAGGRFTSFNGTGRNRIVRIIGHEVLSTPEIVPGQNLSVFPNPTSGNITLRSNKGFENATIRLIDLRGRVVFEKQLFNDLQLHIDISNVPVGVYVFEVQEPNQIERIKIIRQ